MFKSYNDRVFFIKFVVAGVVFDLLSRLAEKQSH